MQRRLAAILAADVVGYSRLIRADEEGTLAAFSALRAEIIDPMIADHHGRVFKLMGDGVLAEFASVVDAVRAAAKVQQAVAERNGITPHDRRIEFRVGINLGDVVIDGDDIHGDGVNVAARLEGLAEPGGILVSAAVYEQVRDRIDVPFEDLGEQQVKNIDRPVHVWRWVRNTALPLTQTTGGSEQRELPEKPSIVVLPFDNMSGDPEQEYFSDGITEDIITDLSKVSGLFVIARNSAFFYKDKAFKVGDVCGDLGVKFAVEGSVRKAANRVRITAQLIDGSSGGHIWAERYDRDLTDIFEVQDDVTEKIVRALEVKLVGTTEARQQTDNPEAYDCVLRGREQYRLFTSDSNVAARKLYKQAIALDPNYAEPYAGLAETYVQDWFMGDQPALDRAFELAQQAAARDPSLPFVQEALSTVHLFKKQHAEALATARRWIDLEPGNADAYATLAGTLHFAGDNEEVIALLEKAMRLNPVYPFFYPHYMGLANLGMRRYDAAVAALKQSIALNPEVLWPHVVLAACYGQLGENSNASAQLAEVHRIHPGFSTPWLLNFMPYKHSGDSNALVEGLRKAGLST
jgi:adenylate cyclase